MPLRCLIVDDSPSFREAMRALLQAQGIEIVGGAGSAAEALSGVLLGLRLRGGLGAGWTNQSHRLRVQVGRSRPSRTF